MLVIELKASIRKSKLPWIKEEEVVAMMKEIYIETCSHSISDPDFNETKYNNHLRKCWNNLNQKMRSLYDSKQIIAYDKKQEFEYFIFKDSHNGLIGNESKTLSVIILTQSRQIEDSISSVLGIIKDKVKKKISFKFLTSSKCKIYAYDYLTRDIHGDNYVVETDLEKNSFMSKSEFVKYAITLLLFLMSTTYLFSKWDKITSNSNGVGFLFNLPLTVNLIAGTGLVLLIDLIYLFVRMLSNRNIIVVKNIQGVIESFDNSVMRGQQVVEDMQEEIGIIE